MRSAALLLVLSTLLLPAAARGADSWTDPFPGIRLLARVETGASPQRIRAAVVSLCEPGMHARATRYDERKTRTSTWASTVGAVVAVNGAFFEYGDYNAIGWSIGDGETWPTAWDAPHYTAVAFASWARARIFATEESFPPEDSYWREMVPGDPLLIDDGVIVQESCYSHFCERHPRTAVGLGADGTTVLLVTVDGRTAVASGMTRLELAQLMLGLGAHRALNLDGGGSTTMVVQGQGVVNTPSDGSERVVSSHLGFTLVPGEPGCCIPQAVAGATGVFADIADGSWVRPYAEALYAAGVTSGCQASPLMFCPDCALDRASLAVLVARSLGLAPVSGSSFSDVPSNAWYAGYVEAIAEAGITSGCAADRFCPTRLATRWEAAVFVFRGMGLPTETPVGMFSDLDGGQAAIVEALANVCVVSGCGAGLFCPTREITRGEAAKLLAVGFSVGGFEPCSSQGGSGGAGGASGAGGSAGAGASAGATSTGTAAAGGAGASNVGVGGAAAGADAAGCGCRLAGSEPSRAPIGLLLALGGVVLRRRKRLGRSAPESRPAFGRHVQEEAMRLRGRTGVEGCEQRVDDGVHVARAAGYLACIACGRSARYSSCEASSKNACKICRPVGSSSGCSNERSSRSKRARSSSAP